MPGRRLNHEHETKLPGATQLGKKRGSVDELVLGFYTQRLHLIPGKGITVSPQNRMVDEAKYTLSRLLDLTETAEGVQIFIGSESELFGLTGCSVVIAPYRDSDRRVVGAVGVVGPTRINYARIIPMVDYTAKVISRLVT